MKMVQHIASRSSAFVITLLVGAALVLTGCDSGLSGPALTESNELAITAGNGGPPASSGPIVIRFEGRTFFGVEDSKTGVGAWFGIDLVPFCQNAGDPSFIDFMSIMDVNVPEDVNRINRMVKGDDIVMSVYDPFTNSCSEIIAGTGFVGNGTADLRSTDNDLNVFLNPDNRNANAFGFNAHGTVETLSGETLRVNAHSRCVWDGNDEDTLKCNDKVNVR